MYVYDTTQHATFILRTGAASRAFKIAAMPTWYSKASPLSQSFLEMIAMRIYVVPCALCCWPGGATHENMQ